MFAPREPGSASPHRRFLAHALVILGYSLLTALLTWPMVARFASAVPGVTGDGSVFVWNEWWFKHALLVEHANPFHTDYIFYPDGISLVYHTFVPLNGLISMPFQLLFGLIAAHNLVVFLSFLLSGYGAFLLIRRVTGHAGASFVGGAVFAFCPYKFAHLYGHFNLTSTEWIPFYVLFLLRITGDDGPARLRDGVLAGVFLLLTAFTDYYYFFFLCLFTAVYGAYLSLCHRPRLLRAGALRAHLVLGVVAALGLSPLAVMAVSAPLDDPVRSLGASAFGADLTGFVTPAVFHPVFGDRAMTIARHFKGNYVEWTVFAGYAVLLLSAIALARYVRTRAAVRFWGLAGLVFGVLALGPYLRVAGHRILPLPYYLVGKIPVLKHLRVPSRLSILVMLCLAVLCAFGLMYLLERIRAPRKRVLVATGILAVILFEYLAVPFPMWDASAPAVYERIAAEPPGGVLLELPLGWSNGFTSVGIPDLHQAYYQTIHRRKRFGGMAARFPESAVERYRSLPLLGSLLKLEEDPRTALDLRAEKARARVAVRDFDIRWVVVRPPCLDSPAHRYLLDVLPLVEIHRDAGLAAYRVER